MAYAKMRLHDSPDKGWPKPPPALDALFSEAMTRLDYDVS
jgi:hypothetical protein